MEFKKIRIEKTDRFDEITGVKIGDIIDVRKYKDNNWFKDREGNIYHKSQIKFIED